MDKYNVLVVLFVSFKGQTPFFSRNRIISKFFKVNIFRKKLSFVN